LDDYVSKLKPGVEKIYFLLAPNREAALNSPYFEPFKNNKDIPVIFINLHVDEMVF
jgi:HSP90 family molecular chaperone